MERILLHKVEASPLYGVDVVVSDQFKNDLRIIGYYEASLAGLDLIVEFAVVTDGSGASVGGVTYVPSHVAALPKYGTDTRSLANMRTYRTRGDGRRAITNFVTVVINW